MHLSMMSQHFKAYQLYWNTFVTDMIRETKLIMSDCHY